MLTRPTARTTAAVLLAALVAVLLVATGGSARAAHRVTAGPGSSASVVGAAAGRHALVVADHGHDRPRLHVDLASTPPAEPALADHAPAHRDASTPQLRDGATAVVPVGRAPPAR